MTFLKRLFNPMGIKRQEEKERTIKKLKKYANDLLKNPLKLEISEEGFPFCPVCKEEFKDKESIINHLKRNKKEFNNLSSIPPTKIEIEKKDKEDGLGIDNLFISGCGFYGLEDDEGKLNFNEWKDVVEIGVREFKLFQEIKTRTYQEWKGETKKKKPREHPISPRLRFQVLQRDNFTCQYCGKKAPEVVLEVDHVEAYSKTKNNDINNLITACKECNRGKRAKDVI